jgi:hypothetical protein
MRKGFPVKMVEVTFLFWEEGTNELRCGRKMIPSRGARPVSGRTKVNAYWEWQTMKRFQQETQKAKGKWELPEDPFLQHIPLIAALLTDAWWDDGKPREVCGLTVRFTSDSCQVSINDTDGKQSITTTSYSLEAALSEMEKGLSEGKSMWRKWKIQTPRK